MSLPLVKRHFEQKLLRTARNPKMLFIRSEIPETSQKWSAVITSVATVYRKGKRRRVVASAFSVNRGAARNSSGNFNSGGWIRTNDLRVMSAGRLPQANYLIKPNFQQFNRIRPAAVGIHIPHFCLAFQSTGYSLGYTF
jgi:hypothetical protein